MKTHTYLKYIKMSLFVGNISPSTTKKLLTSLFEQFGQCEVEFYRRFAYINYTKDSDAKNALNTWNGKDLDGNKLKVEFSQRKPAGYSSPSSEKDIKEEAPCKELDSSSEIEEEPSISQSLLAVPLILSTKTPPNTPNEEIQENSELKEEIFLKSTGKRGLMQEVTGEQVEILQISCGNVGKGGQEDLEEIQVVEICLDVGQDELIGDVKEKVKDSNDGVEKEIGDEDMDIDEDEDKDKDEVEVEVKGNLGNLNEEVKVRVQKEGQGEGATAGHLMEVEGNCVGLGSREKETGIVEVVDKEELKEGFVGEERVQAQSKGEIVLMEIEDESGGDEEIVKEIKVDLDDDDENNLLISTIQPNPSKVILELPAIKSEKPINTILPEPAILSQKPETPNKQNPSIKPISSSDEPKQTQIPPELDLQPTETPSKLIQSPSKQQKYSPFDSMKIERRLVPFNDPFVKQEPEPEKEKPSLLLEMAKKSSEKSKTARKVVNEETKLEFSPIRRKIQMPKKVQKIKENINEANDSKTTNEKIEEVKELITIVEKKGNNLKDKTKKDELKKQKAKEEEEEKLNAKVEEENKKAKEEENKKAKEEEEKQKTKVKENEDLKNVKSHEQGNPALKKTRAANSRSKASVEMVNEKKVADSQKVVENKKEEENKKNRVDVGKEKVETGKKVIASEKKKAEEVKKSVDDLQPLPVPNQPFKIPSLKTLESSSKSTKSNKPAAKPSRPQGKTLLPPPKVQEEPDSSKPASQALPSDSLKFKYEVLDNETLSTGQTVFKVVKQFKDFSNSVVKCCNCGKEVKLKSVPIHLTSKFHKESS